MDESPPITRVPARRIRRNPWIQGLAATPYLFGVGALIAGITVAPPAAFGIIHGVAFGTFASIYAWRRNLWRREVDVEAVVDEEALWVGGERMGRDEIAGAVLVPDLGGTLVRLHRRGLALPVEILVPNEVEGARLLGALGQDVDQTVASFWGMSRLQRSTAQNVLASLAGLGLMGLLAAAGAAALGPVGAMVGFGLGMILQVVLQLAPTAIEVGADGVLLRWLGREEWIPHGDVVWVQTRQKGWGRNQRSMVVLHLEDGRELPVPITQSSLDHGRAEAVATRIRTAKARHAEGGGADLGALLQRGDRPYDEWVATLRASAQRATHRVAPVADERLWRVLEDPRCSPLDRAAAAVALAKGEGKARIERVASATADRRLRVVLDHVADDDDEALVEALAELEQPR